MLAANFEAIKLTASTLQSLRDLSRQNAVATKPYSPDEPLTSSHTMSRCPRWRAYSCNR